MIVLIKLIINSNFEMINFLPKLNEVNYFRFLSQTESDLLFKDQN